MIACLQDLAAVVLRAPFLDVTGTMRNDTLALTALERDEWGDPGTPEGLASMMSMCPYQNIRPSTYPAILVSCAENDVRVPIAGPAKWIARVRKHQQGSAPVLLFASDTGGHFGNDSAEIDVASAELAFMLNALQQSAK